nr:cellulase family glycosylhydrolase [Anaerolineae bacterium]
PSIYDEEYLDYVYEVARKAGDYGITMFIDPHQDVWSRFSGGDGAPGWTLEAVGLDMTHFAETGAAIVHATHGDPFPRMIWPTNNTKLAAATMFTLFFAGNDLAPRTLIDGEPAQEYLQRHYIDAIVEVARRLQGLPNVVGYDTLNEPSRGLIGCADLDDWGAPLKAGESPTPWQAILLGAGYPQEVEVWALQRIGLRRTGTRQLNRQGVRAWRDGCECVWRENGVWDVDAAGRPQLLRPDHFGRVNGRRVGFVDYYYPFAERFSRAIHAVDPDALIFEEVEPETTALPAAAPERTGRVHAPHWYDLAVLLFKEFSPWLAVNVNGHIVLGPRRIRRSFAAHLGRLRDDTTARLGMPTLIGEFGIAFDLRGGRAYRSGDYRAQVAAMDRSMRALDDNLLSGTLWNYTADNSNARGDQWNGEDLSIFSRDQQTDRANINSGGRALQAVVRPYPRAVAGEPLRMGFDHKRRVFEFEFRHDPAVSAPSELFVPNYQYPTGYHVDVSDGACEFDPAGQTLTYRHTTTRERHWLRIRPA